MSKHGQEKMSSRSSGVEDSGQWSRAQREAGTGGGPSSRGVTRQEMNRRNNNETEPENTFSTVQSHITE